MQTQKKKALSSSKPSQKLRVLSSKISYSGPVFSVTTDRVQEPSGVVARRDTIRHSGSIVILAVDDSAELVEPKVLLIRQYRYAARALLWELPAGRIDPGENKLTAAKRELREETGFRAKNWKRALHFYVSPGFLDEVMDIYMATGLTSGEPDPEEDERITTRFFPLSQALDMCMRGKIPDAKTLSAVLWLAIQRSNNF
jgi:ADP-ribose pyrophosphatase